ncbi:hypothetical protein IFM89_010857, partial [Coptis chinensis]
MSLSFRDLRGWIDKQKERLVKRGKEAKLKVLAARDIAITLLKIIQYSPTLILHASPDIVWVHLCNFKFDKIKEIQMSNAVRTDHILLNESGLIFWRLRSCSAELNILLQDVGRQDSDRVEDKWFMYNPEQKKEVETYISHQ